MIKAVIFDCFGVLAEDGWSPFKRKYITPGSELEEQVADLGKRNDAGMLDYEPMIKEMSALVGIDEMVLREAVGRKVPSEELFEFITSKLKPRYKIGMLSNASYDVLHELFTPSQAAIFDATVISHETRLTKPDPRMFALIAERLQVEVSDCLFVDDVERYCLAAEDAGMYSIWYQDLDQCIADLQEVLLSH